MQASSIEVQIVLQSLHYPLTKKDIILEAQKHGASCHVMNVLKNIPDKGYTRATEVSREFKGQFRIWG
jgi:hypothetical protein